MNSTLLESPRTAAATARHTSTSKPDHFPESSGAAKPSKPVVTPHFTYPLDCTSSKVPAIAGAEKNVTKARRADILNIFIKYSFSII